MQTPFRWPDWLGEKPSCTRPRWRRPVRLEPRAEVVAAEHQTGTFGRDPALAHALDTSKADRGQLGPSPGSAPPRRRGGEAERDQRFHHIEEVAA